MAPSIVKQHRTPGETTPEGFQHYGIAPLDPAVPYRHIQRQRHRSGRGIGMGSDGIDDAVQRQAQLSGSSYQDAFVRLVGNQPVDIGDRHPAGRQNFLDNPAQGIDGEFKHFTAAHGDVCGVLAGGVVAGGHPGRHP